MKHLKLRLAALILAMGLGSAAIAGPIVQATSVISPSGSFTAPFNIEKSIDQSGLSSTYTSGVTDFDSFVAGTTHSGLSNSGFLGQNDSLPEYFSFDLGSMFSIDGLAFWSVENAGSVTDFALYSDNDQDATNGFGPALGVFSAAALSDAAAAQVFMFAAVSTQFVQLEVLGPAPAELEYGIGEVAFRMVSVPEPGTLALLGLGLAGFGFTRRRKQS